ncbi:tRNA (guanosine(46)-N7)-methyltransferase TrmB [Rikenella microfusus]|uniref:tRNA (guanine-N(7)-)-methyltransferase n=1 Tax=Rikenella microfusus TaxID=28139 RepID=A0A379MPS3_9BACT|nr:tRNA (guanosine(46)-N7)-methyltransferase TrmB [Rikenella microfusus]SUE32890.1 tRNA (guanine-N(7)-)-methyltransferase [Rikenella microfusus]
MGKNKLRKFSENLTFRCMVQPAFDEIFRKDHPLKGRWREDFFGNDRPIVLELGCGRGEYTVGLAAAHPEVNYIGVDIKGARMWRGAKTATEQGMDNVAFLRTRIEFIGSFFAPDEVDQIWITFPDPQMNKRRVNKRLTAPGFLERYAQFIKADGIVHLKTDSGHLHEYTKAVLAANGIVPSVCCDDIYCKGIADAKLSIKTTYESRFLAEGLPITYLQWSPGGRKIFAAPDFPADELLVGEHTPVR